MAAPATITKIFGLDGVDVYSAPIFARDASFPITNARPYRPQNEVAQFFPTYIGWWEDNMVAPSISAQVVEIDISSIADDCDAAIVYASASSCDYIAPNQKLVPLKSAVIKIEDILRPIAQQRRMDTSVLLNQVFDSSGNFRQGTPYRQHILRYVYATLKRAAEYVFTQYAQTGDDANSVLEVDGLYNQLDNGWSVGSTDCGPENNVAQQINWNYLCTPGVEASAATGMSAPDAVTASGKTVTIHGVSKPVPEGINFAQFMEEIWIDYIETNHTAPYGEVQWEMHIKPGEKYRIRDTVTCMQPCGNDSNFDPDARQRWQDFHKSNVMQLEPSGKQFVMMQTTEIADGVMYFGPRKIGADFTYGLFFQALNNYFQEALMNRPYMYGQSAGMVDAEDQLIWKDETFIEENFESMAFISDLTKVSQTCLQAGTQFKYGVLAAQRHLWVKFTGISSQATFITDPGSSVTIVT